MDGGVIPNDDIDGINTILVRITISDDNVQLSKCLVFDEEDSVWAAKMIILNKLVKDLHNGINYGLYLPVDGARSGKFLEEDRPLAEYHLTEPAQLEFKFKSRDYKGRKFEEKQLRKANSKAKQIKFFELIQKCSVEKVGAFLDKGLDPNIALEEFGGESAIGTASLSVHCKELLLVLVNGGAHVDFRSLSGSTALHTAARADNYSAVQTLLDLGASPNYRDGKGLTPLYNTTMPCGGSADMTLLLMREHSQLMVVDVNGWQEIHQACRNGLQRHLDHLLFYGADIDAQNSNGSTSLHVCAIHGQLDCCRTLLFRGAKKSVANRANHTAQQEALIAGNLEVAELIQNFEQNKAVRSKEKPSYNTPRRKSITTLTATGAGSPRLSPRSTTPQSAMTKAARALLSSTAAAQTSNLPATMEDDSIFGSQSSVDTQTSSGSNSPNTQRTDSDNSSQGQPRKRRQSHPVFMLMNDGPSAFPGPLNAEVAIVEAKTMTVTIPQPPARQLGDESNEETNSSNESSAARQPSSSDEPKRARKDSIDGSSKAATPPPAKTHCLPGGDILRPKKFQRIHKADSSEYVVATEDFTAKSANELSFNKGDLIEVQHFGRDGWWEGLCSDRQGWFPNQLIAVTNQMPQRLPDLNATDGGTKGTETHTDYKLVNVILIKSPSGLGFSLKGVRSQDMLASFKPTVDMPAVQYVGSVDSNSVAEKAGLKKGDFLLSINEKDVTAASHTYAVTLIKQSGKVITLAVARPRSPSESSSRRGSVPSLDSSPRTSRANSLSRRPVDTISSNPSSPAAQRASKQRVVFEDELDDELEAPVSPEGVPLAPVAPRGPPAAQTAGAGAGILADSPKPASSPPSSPKSVRAHRPAPLGQIASLPLATDKLPQSPLAATSGVASFSPKPILRRNTVDANKHASTRAAEPKSPAKVAQTPSPPPPPLQNGEATKMAKADGSGAAKNASPPPPAAKKPFMSLDFMQQLTSAPSAVSAAAKPAAAPTAERGNANGTAMKEQSSQRESPPSAPTAPVAPAAPAAPPASSTPKVGKQKKTGSGSVDLSAGFLMQLGQAPSAQKAAGAVTSPEDTASAGKPKNGGTGKIAAAGTPPANRKSKRMPALVIPPAPARPADKVTTDGTTNSTATPPTDRKDKRTPVIAIPPAPTVPAGKATNDGTATGTPPISRKDKRPPPIAIPPAPAKAPPQLHANLPKVPNPTPSPHGDTQKAPVLNRLNIELEDDDGSGYARIRDKGSDEKDKANASETVSEELAATKPMNANMVLADRSNPYSDVSTVSMRERAGSVPGSGKSNTPGQSPATMRPLPDPGVDGHNTANAGTLPEIRVIGTESKGSSSPPALPTTQQPTQEPAAEAAVEEPSNPAVDPVYAVVNKPKRAEQSPPDSLPLGDEPLANGAAVANSSDATSPTPPLAPPPKLNLDVDDVPTKKKPANLTLADIAAADADREASPPPSPPPPLLPPLTDQEKQANASRIAAARQKHQAKRASQNLTSPVGADVASLVNAAAARRAEEDRHFSFAQPKRCDSPTLSGGRAITSPMASPPEQRRRSQSVNVTTATTTTAAAQQQQQKNGKAKAGARTPTALPMGTIESPLALLVAKARAREERLESGEIKPIDAQRADDRGQDEEPPAGPGPGQGQVLENTPDFLKKRGSVSSGKPVKTPKPKPTGVRQQKPKEKGPGEPSLIQVMMSARSGASPPLSSPVASTGDSTEPPIVNGQPSSSPSPQQDRRVLNLTQFERSPSTHSLENRKAWDELDAGVGDKEKNGDDDGFGVPSMFADDDDDDSDLPAEWATDTVGTDANKATEPDQQSPPSKKHNESGDAKDPSKSPQMSVLVSKFVPPPLAEIRNTSISDSLDSADPPPPMQFSTPPTARAAHTKALGGSQAHQSPLVVPKSAAAVLRAGGGGSPGPPRTPPKPSPKLKKAKTDSAIASPKLAKESPRSSPKFHSPPPPQFSPPVSPAPPPKKISGGAMNKRATSTPSVSKKPEPKAPKTKAQTSAAVESSSPDGSPILERSQDSTDGSRPPRPPFLFGDSMDGSLDARDAEEEDAPPPLPVSLPPELDDSGGVKGDRDASGPCVPASFLDSPVTSRSASLAGDGYLNGSRAMQSPLAESLPLPRENGETANNAGDGHTAHQPAKKEPMQSEVGSLAALSAVVSELDLSAGAQDDDDDDDDDDDVIDGDSGSAFRTKTVLAWTSGDVAAWLDDIGLAQYGQSFVDNDICGEHLAEMNKEDLKELGIVRLGHRLTITNALGKLQA